MSCALHQETLSAFLDGNSGEREAAEAFRHLAECEECRQFLRATIELQHGLRAMAQPAIPSAVDRRILQIPSREEGGRKGWPARVVSFLQHRFTVPGPALAGGICLLLCVLGLSVWLLTRQGLVPERQIIYVVSAPPVEVYGIRSSAENSQQ